MTSSRCLRIRSCDGGDPKETGGVLHTRLAGWRRSASFTREPLQERVLDPACGSGTFFFHAVRKYLQASDAAGRSVRESRGCFLSRVRDGSASRGSDPGPGDLSPGDRLGKADEARAGLYPDSCLSRRLDAVAAEAN